jgi:hypothetical protein
LVKLAYEELGANMTTDDRRNREGPHPTASTFCRRKPRGGRTGARNKPNVGQKEGREGSKEDGMQGEEGIPIDMTEADTVSHVVGFIGLGAMGRPMVGALIEAGMAVVVHDLSADAVEDAAVAGARPAASAAEVAAGTDVVFTMLPYAEDVERAFLGPDGASEGGHPGSVFVDASTIDPMSLMAVAGSLAERGIDAMDAAVSGSPLMARERRATVLVGGGASLFARCRPVLEALGGTLIHTGALGTA